LATKHQLMQKLIRRYKDETGKSEVTMMEVAEYAVRMGMKLPNPVSPIDRLARDFASAAREEIRYDGKTGKPYRANHAIRHKQGDDQYHLWIDIDEAPRHLIWKSLQMRREQMVCDGLQLSYDADHWNSKNPSEKPIQLVLDFTEDIEERKCAPNEKRKVA